MAPGIRDLCLCVKVVRPDCSEPLLGVAATGESRELRVCCGGHHGRGYCARVTTPCSGVPAWCSRVHQGLEGDSP